MKKILKIVLIVFVIIIMIFLINIGRKTYILSKYNEKCKEYQQVTNFHERINQEDATIDILRKDGKAVHKRTSNDGERSIYYDENNTWIIVNIINSNKMAMKISNNRDEASLPRIGATAIYLENIWQTISLAFVSRITTEDMYGIKCYKIYLGEDWQIFVNKDNFLRVREINGNDTGKIEYRINEVTDEEVKLPNLEGYEIKETKN